MLYERREVGKREGALTYSHSSQSWEQRAHEAAKESESHKPRAAWTALG